MRDGNTTISAKPHHPWEEGRANIAADKAMRSKIKQKLSLCTDLLDLSEHNAKLVNIVTCEVKGQSNKIVDQAIEIGIQQLQVVEDQWPDAFHYTVSI